MTVLPQAGEEIGNPPHRGTVNKLREVGIPLVPHRAKQISLEDYDKFDYIIGMDEVNIKYLNRMLKNDPDGKIYKFLFLFRLRKRYCRSVVHRGF